MKDKIEALRRSYLRGLITVDEYEAKLAEYEAIEQRSHVTPVPVSGTRLASQLGIALTMTPCLR